jgi:hypothetical protein
MRKRVFSLVAVLLFCMFVSSCVEDKAVLKQIHEYFPGSSLYKFDKRVLWIQTQVDGVSGKFAEKTLNFVTFYSPDSRYWALDWR